VTTLDEGVTFVRCWECKKKFWTTGRKLLVDGEHETIRCPECNRDVELQNRAGILVTDGISAAACYAEGARLRASCAPNLAKLVFQQQADAVAKEVDEIAYKSTPKFAHLTRIASGANVYVEQCAPPKWLHCYRPCVVCVGIGPAPVLVTSLAEADRHLRAFDGRHPAETPNHEPWMVLNQLFLSELAPAGVWLVPHPEAP